MPHPKQFFLVWNPKGIAQPSFQHASEESARTEAKRLARENQGCEFIVLSSLATFMAPPSLIVEEHDTAPF